MPNLPDYNQLDHLPDNVAEVIRQVASSVVRRNPGIADVEDMEQVAWEWILNNGKEIASAWFFQTKNHEIVFSFRSMRMRLNHIMMRDIEKSRHAMGVDVMTEAESYGRKEIETLLPYIWHSQVLAKTGDTEEGPKPKTDPALGGDRMAKVADLKVAYEEAIAPGSNEDKVLLLTYGAGWTQEDIADEVGIHANSISRVTKRGVGRLLDYLNGDYKKTANEIAMDAWPQGPGTRKAISNAQAAMLRRDTENG